MRDRYFTVIFGVVASALATAMNILFMWAQPTGDGLAMPPQRPPLSIHQVALALSVVLTVALSVIWVDRYGGSEDA